MGIFPTPPRANFSSGGIKDNGENRERDGIHHLCHRQCHEAKVAADSEGGMGAKELVKLHPALIELD